MNYLKLTLIALSAAVIMGCATNGNDAYVTAHTAASQRGIAEAQQKADADKALSKAASDVGAKCDSDMCRMGAFLTFSNMKAASGAVTQSAAPVIAAPVNEAVEVFKDITKTALGLYGLRINGALGLVNATKGAADTGAAMEGLSSLDVVRIAAPEAQK